jgi:2-polyprenyl-6-methoxyphenol hydroxylase-like FAD-dependent oxidoreductase
MIVVRNEVEERAVRTFDVIVVGGRCAGASLALRLAGRGHRVLVVDRATFPSDTLSTHFVHVSGVEQLHQLGVLDEVWRTGCPPIERMVIDFGPFQLAGTPPPGEHVSEMLCCRRTALDKVMLEAAAQRGAEVRQGCRVTELVWQDGRVAGIRGQDEGGKLFVERATLVVGADGRNSLVARAVGAPAYEVVPPLTCAFYSYWSGVEVTEARLYSRPGRAMAAMPTNDGSTCVFVAARHAQFGEFRSDLDAAFARSVTLAPDLAERLAGGRREERFRATADLPNFMRRPWGPGWALVGDAGCHKDPVAAQGISDALRDADLLASAVHDALTGARGWDTALAAYEDARNQVELPRYRLGIQLATLEPPPPEEAARLAAAAADENHTRRFLGLLSGTAQVEDPSPPADLSSR